MSETHLALLYEPGRILRVLIRLTQECVRLRWSVAWASSTAPLAKVLLAHKAKVAQLTVGVHFYQTDPEFMRSFMECSEARFVMQPSGTFHPKVYCFEHADGTWDCVIGSANLTHAATSRNSEAMVHIGGVRGDSPWLSQVFAMLKSHHDLGQALDEEALEQYRRAAKVQQPRLQAVGGLYGEEESERKSSSSPLASALFTQTWPEFYDGIARSSRLMSSSALEERLRVLEEAHRLFAAKSFGGMTPDERKCISGIVKSERFDWLWFGSMRGAGTFKKAVNQSSKLLSEALDCIPLAGAVTQRDYDRYVRVFKRAVARPGIATSTRLLCMRRPDYFVCLDSANRRKLCEAFGTKQSVGIEDYWGRIVARILDSAWWDSEEPSRGLQLRVWRGRVAMLDAHFYEPA